MKVAILGYDVEGRASFDYFAALGHELTICDQNTEVEVPNGVASVLGDSYLDDLDRFDLLVRTAGLRPQKILEKNPSVAIKITTQVNEFLRVCPTKNVVGVTGTKGKGTTSTLIAKMLEATGKQVRLGGNIGVPPMTFLSELNKDSWVVLELSSFQLIDLQHSTHIAVCLMVVPEHLDWHPDINLYTLAKSQLFIQQSADDIAIYFADNELSSLITSNSPGQKIPYFTPPGAFVEDGIIVIDGQLICPVSELKLLGKHNWQNACAAVTAVWNTGAESQNAEAIRSVLTSFSGLEHRLEMVRELNGVKYFNDSFGTTPETAIAAIESFDQPEIVILGGHGKGIPFIELAKVVANHQVKHVITIGETGPEIAEDLRAQGFANIVNGGQNIYEIVSQVQQLTEPGDVVVFSTANASFDMFKNYKDRGEQFKQAVQALASTEE